MERTVTVRVEYAGSIKRATADATAVNEQFLNELVRGFYGISDFNLSRKSKRHKGYIPLQSDNDYKSLKRSLEVKNHIKLRVETSQTLSASAAAATTDVGNDVVISQERFDALCSQLKNISITLGEHINNKTSSPKVCHQHVTCDGCYPEGSSSLGYIEGIRYKCQDCDDFDLCSRCYDLKPTIGPHDPSHRMLAIHRPLDQSSWASDKGDDIFVDFTSKDDSFNSTMLKLIQDYDTAEKLNELLDNDKKYRRLCGLAGDEALLAELVRKGMSMEQKPTKHGPNVDVEVYLKDSQMKFKITNRGGEELPPRLLFKFAALTEGEGAMVVKISMGPHSVHPGGFRNLSYNLLNLSHERFWRGYPFSAELFSEDGSVFALGKCTDRSDIAHLTAPGASSLDEKLTKLSNHDTDNGSISDISDEEDIDDHATIVENSITSQHKTESNPEFSDAVEINPSEFSDLDDDGSSSIPSDYEILSTDGYNTE